MAGASRNRLFPPLVWCLGNAGTMAAWTYLPNLSRERGIPDTDIGIAVTLYGIMMLFSSYLCGRASDMHGRKRFIYMGLAFSALITLAHLLVFRSATLCFVRALMGLAIGMFPPAFIDYVMRSNGKLGRFSGWGSLGWGIGAFGGGLLAYFSDSLVTPFLFAAALFILAYLAAFRMPVVEEIRQVIPLFPKKLIWDNLPIFIPLLLRHAGACGIWAFWPLFIADLGANYLWLGINQLINPLTQFFVMGALTDRLRSSFLFPAGLILSALAAVTFIIVRNHYELLPTQVLLGISWSFCYVGALRSVTENAKEKATASGLLTSVTSLAQVIGPALGTVLIAIYHSYRATMVVAAMTAVLAYGVYYLLRALIPDKQLSDKLAA